MKSASGILLARCRVALLASACVYLVLLPTGAATFWRSLAFAASAVLTLVVVTALLRSRAEPLPSTGIAVPAAVLGWSLWSIASVAWSVDPSFSAQEVKSDVLWGLATMAIFYFAASVTRDGFRVLAATLLASLGFWTALAVGSQLSPAGWDARLFHRGEGAFATYLVTVAPFLALLLWQPPVGLAAGRRSLAMAALLLALVLVAARMSDNRILWIAFAASAIIIASAVRPRATAVSTTALAGLLVFVLALLFIDAARQRAELASPANSSVAATLANDPRLAIWKHAINRIRVRPWQGYGYGQHILGVQLGADTGDPRIKHPHNLFASQWLQTGAIGLALFVLMLVSLAARYGRFVRSADVALARVGAVGLAVLAAFVIRNLTDDFFIRANGKLLFAANAMLLGLGALRMRELEKASASAPSAVAAPAAGAAR